MLVANQFSFLLLKKYFLNAKNILVIKYFSDEGFSIELLEGEGGRHFNVALEKFINFSMQTHKTFRQQQESLTTLFVQMNGKFRLNLKMKI